MIYYRPYQKSHTISGYSSQKLSKSTTLDLKKKTTINFLRQIPLCGELKLALLS